ncbi:IclR family transcriptional regulator C-terminal domain-containing protein [Glycomyces sp. NPDC046736]|uniref:IclR family transcriptional regulator domain-containing protein n=1 Tax=Glycomyces sp. NPDC046736 TaxID=3155615 RepID=UPI00340D7B2A
MQTVLANPGRTTKQLRRLLTEGGDVMSDQTLRTHLDVLTEGGWLIRDVFRQYNPGPTVAGGEPLVRGFQTVLDHLRKAPHGLTPTELADELNINLYSAKSAIGIGIEFNVITETAAGSGRFRLDSDGMLLPVCTASDSEIDAVLAAFVASSGRDAGLFTLSQEEGLVISHVHQDPDGSSRLADTSPKAAHATAGGQAALAWLDEVQRTRYLRTHGMEQYTPKTITSMTELESVLVREPAHIYASAGQYRECCTCLAILVHNGARTDERIALTTSTHIDTPVPDMRILEAHLYRAATALSNLIDGPLRRTDPSPQ